LRRGILHQEQSSMNFVSIFGLLAILGLAWSMSYHRNKVNPRIIFWGLGLQFIFGMIILREGFLSGLGMVMLAVLVANYCAKEVNFNVGGTPVRIIFVSLLSTIIIYSSYIAAASIPMGVLLVLLVIALTINGFKIGHQSFTVWGSVTFIAALVGYLISNDLWGRVLFESLSEKVEAFLALSDYGAKFIFGNLADGQYFFTGNDTFPGFGFQFAFKVLPTIIFFGGFMSVLYYLGIIQKVIDAMAKFMRWTLGTSGAETMSCSANVFVGQTEAPLLVKPFLADMTPSELLTIMVGGFATIAGGVLAGYVGMGINPGHLLAASVMSAPAALVIGKIIYPETEHSATAGDVALPEIDMGGNVLEAASNGISDGLKLALNVGAMLIGFIALIAVLDLILNTMDYYIDNKFRAWLGYEVQYYAYKITGDSPAVGEYAGFFPGSLQTFFGYLLRPLAFLMGVPWEDAAAVGNLLGVKLSLNEFVAFNNLATYINSGVIGERAGIIATYALCGFANFSSIGIQIGGIASLAPERRAVLAKVALKAMFGGAFASWTTAIVAGVLL
jgi:CNT family concentrative nucleoside transporter